MGGRVPRPRAGHPGHNPHLHGPADHSRHRQQEGAQVSLRTHVVRVGELRLF